MNALFMLLSASAMPAAAPVLHDRDLRTYKADVTSSEILWKGYKVTGQHSGIIQLQSGTVFFEDDVLAGGEFVVDMTTLKDLDLTDTSYATKLEGHLKSDDFFGVETYPTARLVMTNVVPDGTHGDYQITGNLTIKDITHPISFVAHVTEQNGNITATADLQIDRSKYNVRYGSGSFFDNLGDKVIYDNFDLNITLSLIQA